MKEKITNIKASAKVTPKEVTSFIIPDGELHYDYCRTCGYWNKNDKTPDGRCFCTCTNMGGYHSGGDGCGYHT